MNPWLYRHDCWEFLDAPVESAEGFRTFDGVIARCGILTYHIDGKVRRELVTRDTLNSGLGSLVFKPVTLQHPPEDVTPDNVERWGVGTVGQTPSVVEDALKARFVVQRSDALSAVKAGVQQLSPGYLVRCDESPGVHPEHGPYDAIQVERRYTHLAIVDRARGGEMVRLRADSWSDPLHPVILAALKRYNLDPSRYDSDASALAAIEQAAAAVATPAIPAQAATVAEMERLKGEIAALQKAREEMAAREAELTAKVAALEKAASEMPAPDQAIEMVVEMEMPESGMTTDVCGPGGVKMDAATATKARRALDSALASRAQYEPLFVANKIPPGKLNARKRALAEKLAPGSVRADSTDAFVDGILTVATRNPVAPPATTQYPSFAGGDPARKDSAPTPPSTPKTLNDAAIESLTTAKAGN